MILDTSAILAVIFREPERESYREAIDAAGGVGIGAPTYVESAVVLMASFGPAGRSHLDSFLAGTGSVLIPFDTQHVEAATQAWLRFGRGRHPAALNFGDCFAYATAKVAGQPLLAKGDDFAQTDIELA